jgi:hypothetical protein
MERAVMFGPENMCSMLMLAVSVRLPLPVNSFAL